MPFCDGSNIVESVTPKRFPVVSVVKPLANVGVLYMTCAVQPPADGLNSNTVPPTPTPAAADNDVDVEVARPVHDRAGSRIFGVGRTTNVVEDGFRPGGSPRTQFERDVSACWQCRRSSERLGRLGGLRRFTDHSDAFLRLLQTLGRPL